MNPIFVSGLINLETTLQVDGFPIPYFPVRYPFFGVKSTVSGVGTNVARALTALGRPVMFASLVGSDPAGRLAFEALQNGGVATDHILPLLAQTPQSVILYDSSGRRQINVDLKDIQERSYPQEMIVGDLASCDLAALCNINFSRPMLRLARTAGKRIATDVHAIGSLDDEYNQDFMRAADILFMSDESLPEAPEGWARRVVGRFANEIVVIGMGGRGALLAVRRDHYFGAFPAVYTRPVVNTIGAGDALFSSFLHFYLKQGDPYQALEKALRFASFKIGASGAAEGFLSEDELEKAYPEVHQR
jgi:acarbose 7IV-phosphotransferase